MKNETTIFMRRGFDGMLRFAGAMDAPTKEQIDLAAATGLICIRLLNHYSDEQIRVTEAQQLGQADKPIRDALRRLAAQPICLGCQMPYNKPYHKNCWMEAALVAAGLVLPGSRVGEVLHEDKA